MSKIMIHAKGITKEYIIGGAEQHYDSFRELLSNFFKSPFKKIKTLKGDVPDESRFCALDDINFTIDKGDVIGVIGHNGAGKSTLLKILSRITAPTQGELVIHGSVASLLEVGTGFHPELTGRENIYLNGSILGMSRKQIDAHFSEIVEFAEVEKFLDTPVKRYSSGMYVRLAFSVAAHLDSDVLLVDEVLAVGDQAFQKKCLGKLGDVSAEGRTVLFVSHNLSLVTQLCEKVLVLEKGKIIFKGSVNQGISIYNQSAINGEVLSEKDYFGDLYPNVKFDQMLFDGTLFNENVELDPLKQTNIVIDGSSNTHDPAFRITISIKRGGLLLFTMYDAEKPTELKPVQFRSSFTIPSHLLLPGEYTISISGGSSETSRWLRTRDYRFTVAPRWDVGYESSSILAGEINIKKYGQRVYLNN